jgi:hypothetical protein
MFSAALHTFFTFDCDVPEAAEGAGDAILSGSD